MTPRTALNVGSGRATTAARRLMQPQTLGLFVLAALTCLLAGDRIHAQSAGGLGIDPLGVLDLQVKANAVVVLDSSGSMREIPSVSLVNGISNGDLVGDDPNSKMVMAKGVLTTIIQQNQAKVKFRFGQYTQPVANITLSTTDRFFYATTDARAATLSINSTGNGASSPGISRNTGSDTVTISGTPYYYLTAGKFWNGQTIRTDTKAVVATGTKTNPAQVWLRTTNSNLDCSANPTNTNCVAFTFKGAYWGRGDGTCTGFQELQPLAACSMVDQFDGPNGIGQYLAPELKINANGDINGYVDGTLGGAPTSWPTPNGMKADGSTPIMASLRDIKTWFQGTLWPSLTSPKPKTFVVFVTDGDDQCVFGSSPYDNDAMAAAYRAQQLYTRVSSTEGTSSVTTYVVLIGTDPDAINHANWVAWAGSGMGSTGFPSIPTTGSGNQTRWSRAPTAAEVSTCKAAGGCTDAFTATNTDDLTAAIQAAIDQGAAAGQFSAAPTITENVWEYGADVGVDPKDPAQRYNAFVPVVFQPVFDASNFTGTFSAYSGVPSVLKWEASAKLAARLNISTPSLFSALHGGSTPANIGAGSALIMRRIYTTSGNGAFTDTTSRTPVPLWPPTTSGTGAVAPANDTAAGGLDTALGIVGTGDAAEFASLQATYGACRGTTLPTACSGTVAQKVARARREAREQILAYTAGAVAARDANGNPSRSTASGSSGEILYQARTGSLLAETTLASPAVITPPIQVPTNAHNTEYVLYRDGPRNGSSAVNGIDLGFGLRNPDNDGTTASKNDNTLKPVMTVVYLPTNQMLHAFRAGPCLAGTCADTGGEELWGFVPYDQLGKLAGRMKPQKRDPHTYVLDAALRFADVFVPEAFNQSVGGVSVNIAGRWRTILYVGRGIAGKYLTALDVTVPGPATRAAMGSTAINPPLVMWNRGNPDTRDGTAGGTANNTTADKTAYSGMGQTWSVPAVVRVNPANNTTTRNPSPGGVEFVAYVGSGYSSVTTEGTTFYALDALTGDVVASFNVGDRTTGAIFPDNALLASPSALTPDTFNLSSFVHPSDALATRVYAPDIHGRLWRFPTTAAGITASSQTAAPTASAGGLFADFGANQPIANAVALLYYNSDGSSAKPHVYAESGNDQRVTPPGDTPPFATTPPFNMYGLRDEDLTSDPNPSDSVGGPARVLFIEPFVNNPPPGYRGTVQPAAAVNNQGKGRVFFAGTQFTPTGTDCVSSLDSVLYALTGVNGDAAFDLNATGQDKYIMLPDQVINDIQIVRQTPTSGQLNISRGIGGIGQPPPVPKVPAGRNAAPPGHGDVYPMDIRLSSTACQ